jgi:hypothetical protein
MGKKGGSNDVYRSPNLGGYENASYGGLMNRLGAGANNSGGGAYNYAGTQPYGSGSSGSSFAPGYYSGSSANHPYTKTLGSSGGSSGWNQIDPYQANAGNNYGAPPGVSLQGGGGGLPGKIAGGIIGGIGGGLLGQPQLGASLGAGLGSLSSRNSSGGGGMPDQGNYNTSQIGSPLGGPAGIQTATAGYNWDPQNQAIQGLSGMAGKYNPYQFNFQNLPDTYTKEAFQQGASDIGRQGQNTAAQLRENIGTRRPGLLMKGTEDTQRGTNQNLGQLRTSLDLNRINQNVATQQAQQQAQAGENANASNINSGLFQNLFNAGQGMVGTQSGLLQNERGYQDQALQMLMQMYQAATGQANTAAATQAQAQANSLKGIGSLASGVADIKNAW